jgi:two-component system NarL family response regulator
VIEGISNLLKAHGLEVVGIANDGLEAVALAEQCHPDLILMDIRMPRCDGLTATRMIKAARPEAKIVMLTTSTEDQDLFEAVKSGACGYLLKSMSGEAFIEALRNAERGVPPFSPGLAARLLDEFVRLSENQELEKGGEDETETRKRKDAETGGGGDAENLSPCPDLTERQAEVLRLVASGLTYKEVGEQLSLSERTVRFHMTQIMNRLHLYNRNQVLAYAGELRSAGR